MRAPPLRPRPRFTRWVALLLLATGACTLPPPSFAAPPAPPDVVEAVLEWEPAPIGPQTVMTLPLAPLPPKDAIVPEGLVEPRYARIRWGAGPGLLFAADVSQAQARIWVDTNLDGSLLDEARSLWTKEATRWTRSETVRVAYEGEGAPEEVPIRLEHMTAWAADMVRIVPDGHREGTLVLAGRVRRVALADRNSDMRFDDAEVDRLYLDVDGDGLLTVSEGSHEQLAPGKVVRVGAEGWVPEVASPSGRRVRFRRSAEVPPRVARPWQGFTAPQAGVAQQPPSEPIEDVLRRIDAEAAQPYAGRYATISLLGRYGTPAAMKRLLQLVEQESDLNVRGAAVRALGNPAWLEAAGPALLKLGDDPQPSVAGAALDALHAMGHPKREARYLALLQSAAPVVAGAAARNLGYLGSPAAWEALRATFERAKDGYVRYQAYTALRYAPTGPALAMVRSAAKDDYASLRGQGLQDAAALDLEDAEALAIEAAAVRPVTDYLGGIVIELLGAAGSRKAVEALLELGVAAPSSLDARLLQALGPLRDTGAIEALLAGLKSKEPRLRGLCAQALAGVASRQVADALLSRAGKEKDDPTLAAVLEALGDQKDPRARDVLLAHARGKADEPRRAAIRALARVGLSDEQVRAFFAGLLASKDWEDRVVALDAVAGSRDASLVAKVAPSVEHERLAVRLAAVEALGALRHTACIPPLIARLEREEEPRVRDAIAHALYGMTGMNLYDDLGAWQRWWAANGKGFVVPEKVPPLPPANAGDTRAGFYGIPVSSGRVVFVIDQSGSMSAQDTGPVVTGGPGSAGGAGGNRLDMAVREVLRAVKAMKDRDRVHLILFHSTVHPWRGGLERLVPATRSALEKHLLEQQPMGGTNLYDALELALDADGVDTIFLLSDGAPGSGKYVATDDILRAVRRINQTRRIAIHTISIGRDSDLMQRLAAENGGQYVRR